MSGQLTLLPQAPERVGAPTVPWLLGEPSRGEVTWTDLFCGGGGSSLGLHHVPGFHVKYALNHWDLAIQAHQANFPDTDHEVTLIEDVHPKRFGRTDCGWFSPSCTSHAYCGPRGGDEESERSRATMWDVCRWTEHHRYDVVIVENVVEVKLWCDEHRTGAGGKADTCSCGASFEAWVRKMTDLGYTAREVYFNSQFALVPQSRDRVYVVFVRDGIAMPNLDFAPPCWCSECGEVVAGRQTFKRPARGSARDRDRRLGRWGRYGKQYMYTCANAGCEAVVAPAVLGSWSIIDHSLPIDTIASRNRPIAAATRKRIKVGIERLGKVAPMQVQVGGNLFERPGYARVWSLDDPLRTITTTPYMAAVIPNKANNVGRTLHEPVGTITTAPAGHMLVSMRKHGAGETVATPAPTVTAGGHHHALLVYNGNPGFVRVLDDAAGTVTARDKQSLLVPYNRTARAHGDHEPLTAITTRDRSALLEVTEQDIDECLFRMLKWPELQRGQGMHLMPDGSPYQLTARVRTKRGTYKDLTDEQRVKMIGNAVSSPVAAMLGHAVAASLAAAA